MSSYRIGKSLEFKWAILTNGDPLPLEGRDLKLVVSSPYHEEMELPFETDGNVVKFTFEGMDQSFLGSYTFTLIENLGKSPQSVVDACNVFELVARSCQESREPICLEPGNIEVSVPGAPGFGTIDAETDHEVGFPEVSVETSGPSTAKNIHFRFSRLTPEITSSEDGTILSNGEVVSTAIPDAIGKLFNGGYVNPTQKPLLRNIATDIRQRATALVAEAETLAVSSDAFAAATQRAMSALDKYTQEDPELIPIEADYADIESWYVARASLEMDLASAAKRSSDTLSQRITDVRQEAKDDMSAHNTSGTAHTDIRELLAACAGLPTYDPATYKLTFQTTSGRQLVVDLPIEQMDLRYNSETQSIEWDNGDGSVSSVPVSEFIKEYVGSNGAEIVVSIGEGNTIQASIVANSISWEKLSLALQQKIDDKADTTYVNGQVNAEKNAREQADTTLQGNIDAEKRSREQADTTLQGNISAEKTRAEGQEAAIRSEFAAADTANLAEAKEYAASKISEHNSSKVAHEDLRELLAGCTGLPTYDPATYKLTFQTTGGQQLVVDLPIEQMDLRYNAETQSIEWDNGDGSVSSVPVSEFIKEYVGSNGAEIVVSIGEGNTIQASIVANSISWEKLSLALQQKIDDKADTTYVDEGSVPAKANASLGQSVMTAGTSPSVTPSADSVTISFKKRSRSSAAGEFGSETSVNMSVPAATQETAGVMSAADKKKLDSLSGGGGGDSDINVVQTTGSSTTDVMSQAAVTNELGKKVNAEKGKVLSANDYTNEEKQKVANALLFTEQTLTGEQQTRARTNIGAVSEQEVDNKVSAERTRAEGQEAAIRSEFAAADTANLQTAEQYSDNAVSTHNTSGTAHTDIRELLNTCTGLPTYDPATYKLTFQTTSGQQLVVDLPIEQMDLRYNAETQSIEWDNGDGSVSSVPVSEFIKEYVGSNGTEVIVSIGEGNVIQASIVANSIAWEKLSLALQQKIDAKADTTYVNGQVNAEKSAREQADTTLQGNIDTKLSIDTYNADKLTFATKDEIGAINDVLDNINGEVI